MDITADFFTLFDLPKCFRLDVGALDMRYRDLQAEVHPDRFAQSTEAERRLSIQWATRANEAYQTLKNPLQRARYLLELAGHDIQAENNTAMPMDFLMEQMAWREAVMEARSEGNESALEDLHERLDADIRSRHEELAQLLDEARDFTLATDRVRRLMFLEKLLHEINDALASFD